METRAAKGANGRQRTFRFFDKSVGGRSRPSRLILVLLLLAVAPLLAVTPQLWEIRTYDDFRKGKLTNLSLTSDDELILAPKFDPVFNTEQTLVWSTVADSKGNVYLGTGHDGKIFKVDPSGKG